MTTENRREFLKTLARGAAYAAPVVISMSAPVGLAAQGKSSQHKAGSPAAIQQSPPSGNAVGGTPPWEAPPPGR